MESNMRLKFILPQIFICAFLLASLHLHAQTSLLNISMSDTTVEAVISEIRKQTDMDFIFNHEELDKIPRVSIEARGETVEQVLEQCLMNTGFSFEKVNNTIIITPEKKEDSGARSRSFRTQTLRGTVLDRDSRIPLPFASVVIMDTNPQRGTTTNLDGNFSFEKLPVGRYTLQISYVGYEEAVVQEILLGSAKEVILSVEIRERTQSIGEVFVRYKKGEALDQMTTVSSRSFSVEETKRYPASVSDPARMAQVFAGVSGTDDSSNEIVIRGNSPYWLLWRLEGVEIPSPNHFAEEGFHTGSISILSTNLLGTSDFHMGAFPAEYGSALSGVFDINLRNGNSQVREYSLQAGLLGIDLSAEGPFKDGYRGSYLFNYRYSTFALMDQMNISVSQNALPEYQDLSFKFNMPTKKAGVFSLWGLGGVGDDNENYVPDTIAGENPEYGYRDNTTTGMFASGLSHIIYPDNKSYVRSVVSFSGSYSSETFDDMDSLGFYKERIYDELQNKAVRISTLYNRKVSRHMSLQTGFTYSYLYYDYYSRQSASTGSPDTVLNSAGNTNLYQFYLQSRYAFSERFVFKAGLHFAHFALSSDNSLEPRLGFTINLPKEQKLTFGVGLHSKNENLPVYFAETEKPDGSAYLPNLGLEMTRSMHYIMGYEKIFGSDFQLKSEVYYQHINKLPVPTNPDKYWAPMYGGVNYGDTLANIGEGRNYGLELTLQKFFTRSYYFLFSSSLFDSKYKPADGMWYNTKFNLGFINNMVGGKEFMWGSNKMVGLNLRMIWSGGRRILTVDLPDSIEDGRTVYQDYDLFSKQARDYFRIDFGLKLHFFREKSEHVLSLDIQNLTNRQNVLAEEYNPETEGIEEYHMTGFIPIINYRLEF
jgi:hypothetical protein